MFTQWVPHEWSDKPMPAELDAYADRDRERRRGCPGFTSSILHRTVIGPHEMEHEYGSHRRQHLPGELSPDQLFHMRPALRLR
jgi:phytoene dehydrogenase-like protein